MIRRIALSLSIVFGSTQLSFADEDFADEHFADQGTESSEAASPMVKVFSRLKVPLNLARHLFYSGPKRLYRW
ncbi:hypothetical protein O9992_04660 [Vibrio lentus]|nr:hypothetical protein [Vibrio lentus]